MQLRANKPTRSLAYLLTKLSPLDITNATQAYVESQPPDRIAALVHHALPRMESAERRQFGAIFGVQSPAHDSFFDEEAPPLEDLIAAVDASGDGVSDGFLRFMRQNPRALETLDRPVLEKIISDAVSLGTTNVEDAVPSEEIDPADEPQHRLESIAITAIDVIGSLARPFVATGKAVARTIAAIPSALLAGLRWLAQPFVWGYRAILAVVRAIGRAIAAIPGFVVALLRWLAQPFVWIYRGVVAIPRIVARAFVYAALPFVAFGRALGNAARAVRSIRVPRVSMPRIRVPRLHAPRLSWSAAAIFAAAIAYGAISAVAIVAFRHAGQRAPQAVAAATTHSAPASTRKAAPKRAHAPAHRPRILVAAVPKPTQRVHAHRESPKTVAPAVKPHGRRVAVVPQHRPQPHRRGRRFVDVADLPLVARRSARRNPLLERARLEVASYLASLKRGDQRGALTRLGLAPDAPVSNLTEARAVSNGRFRIVDAAPGENGGAKVDVEIHSQAQHFFGVYTVSAIGPAVQITSHTLIPVGGPGAIAGP